MGRSFVAALRAATEFFDCHYLRRGGWVHDAQLRAERNSSDERGNAMRRILFVAALASMLVAPVGVTHAGIIEYEVAGQFATPSGATLSGHFFVDSSLPLPYGFDFEVTLPSD